MVVALYRAKVRFFRLHRSQTAAAALVVLFAAVSRVRLVLRALFGVRPAGVALRPRDLWR
jgi:hypothetical protein